ncbi:hypothetical protein CcI49_02990 [Frankia sp. CcI49]|uniref:DUF3987 domain-containing protein n=1 Tax=Frankia sp. CcI49 TaxID=1745382 RepID=UPI0009771C53|nr:DUF3987 domain-containing protein [Frankia sp. CcI49]ONH62361.1 hypothetical protein CcI49_02990 [Frankia sp. CcI49]
MRALGADGASESGAAGSRRSGQQRGGGERDAQVHLHPAAVAAGADGPEIDPGLLRAERECLGLALRDPEALTVVLGTLESSDYLRPAHQMIHAALMEMHPERPVDEGSVVTYLSERTMPMGSGKPIPLLSRVGGAVYLHDLVWNTSATSAQAGYYVRQVADAATRRAVAEQADALRQLAASSTVEPELLEGMLDKIRERLRWRPGVGWAEPRPLNRAMPPLPVDSLPGVVRRFVHAVAATTQTPPDLATFAALATLSGATRGGWEVRVTGKWTEQTCLYLAALSDSGSRKSAVVKAAAGPLSELEWSAQDVAALARERAERELTTKRLAAAMDRAAREGDEEARREVDELSERLALEGEPTEFQILADDTTAEGLAILMRDQGGPQAIIVDEGGFLGTLAGRYASSGQANVDLVLRAYDGASVKINRASKPAIRIRRPILSIGMVVQPDVINEALKVRAFVQRGLMARFLYALPATTVGTRGLEAPEMDPAVEAEWAGVIGKIVAASRDLTGRDEVCGIHLDHAARVAFDSWRGPSGHEGRLHPELGDLVDIGSWASKLPGALVRIAALFALAERPGDAHPMVTGPEMQAALDLAPYLVEHAREVLVGGQSERGERLRAVLGWLSNFSRGEDQLPKSENRPTNASEADIEGEAVTFNLQDVYRALDGRAWVTKIADIEDVVEHLADLGYVRRLPAPTERRRGRPPSPRYQVHPRVVAVARRGRR